MISGSLWNYYRDEINDDANENVNSRINNNKTMTSKCFKYKTKLIESAPNDNNKLGAEVVAPLKHLSNFWKYLDFPLVNYETEIDLSRPKECMPRIPGDEDADPPVQEVPAIQTTAAIFQINNAKLYVPVVTLSINDDINFQKI